MLNWLRCLRRCWLNDHSGAGTLPPHGVQPEAKRLEQLKMPPITCSGPTSQGLVGVVWAGGWLIREGVT